MYASLGNLDEMKLLWGLQKAKCKKHTNINYIWMLGSLVKLGELEESEKLLKEWESSCKNYDFGVPNVPLIGYCQKGFVEKTEAMLQDIIKRRKTAIPNSWSIVAAGYVNKNNIEKAFECFKEALALLAENKDWRPKTSLISSILRWRTKVPTNRDMYHALLKAFIRNGKEVEGLLECMRDDKIDEDEETMKILSLGEQKP
ncbi:pentatricopeptide repeat-containing protein At4g21705, mitochondrial-like [Durio zibethinus]|uniref:Pentatricopeptide repeat-containing protein At4g21705, mitochondrial-like n=1 Tax=Durio zibethinus TaxID=66656 RepID=A0A6P5Y583_DURZI|nr:pentatricopeptide repeat-containing protein At4g21705, mitochondrial-like [Durio zibethinus]